MVSPHDPFHPRSAPASDRVDRKCVSPGPEDGELATRAQAAAKGGPGDLPKIEGPPNTTP
jgi:hypothetical protein